MADLRNLTTGEIVSSSVDRAGTPWHRAIGLLLSHPIAPERGLWFPGCRAIHTLGMRDRIDVIFLDGMGNVVAVEPAVRPNRPIVAHRGADAIVEMGSGFLARRTVAVGDRLGLAENAA